MSGVTLPFLVANVASIIAFSLGYFGEATAKLVIEKKELDEIKKWPWVFRFLISAH